MSKHRPEISQAEFERIERYLLGRMDGAERRALESEMAADTKLRDEVALQRRLMAAVEAGTFRVPQQEEPAPLAHKPPRKPDRMWLYAAAVIAVVFGYLGWRISQPTPPAEADLFTTYFYPDPGLPVTMSSTDRYAFYDGMVSYKEENYSAAMLRWRALPAAMLTSDTVQYYLGMASLNNGDLADATSYLRPVVANDLSAFHHKAVWYRSLIHIEQGEYRDAVRLLETLPSEKRVTELLGRLAALEQEN